MILFKEEPILLNQRNIIMLDCNGDSGNVIYVSHHTYTQAAVIESNYGADIERVAKELGVDVIESEYAEAIDTFYTGVDGPLNMLAPFLGLLDAIKFDQSDIVACCGMLHIISNTINFRSFLSAEASVRADVRFVSAVLKTYQRSWEEIETQLVVPKRDLDVETSLAAILTAHLELINEMRVNGPVIVRETVDEEKELAKRIDKDKVTFNEPVIDWDKMWADANEEAEEATKAKLAEEAGDNKATKPAVVPVAPPPPPPPVFEAKPNVDGGASTIERALGSSASALSDVPTGKQRPDEQAAFEDILSQYGSGGGK